MQKFLALHDLADGEAMKRDALTRLAEASHDLGVRPVETFYSPGRDSAYTLFEANSVEEVRRAAELAGLHALDVVPTERVFTELLDRPHKARRD